MKKITEGALEDAIAKIKAANNHKATHNDPKFDAFKKQHDANRKTGDELMARIKKMSNKELDSAHKARKESVELNELSKKVLWSYIGKAGKNLDDPDKPKREKRVAGINRAGHKVYKEEVATNATGVNVAGTGDTGDAWRKLKKRMSKRLMDFYKGV